ncbi:MAG: hypothetical protein ACKVPX_16385 [Myxococcaceae bacterium]
MASVREKLENALREYGPIAMGVYLGIFVLAMLGFSIALKAGLPVSGVGQHAGLLGAAWVATKLTQPLRIAATLLLTPFVARWVRR